MTQQSSHPKLGRLIATFHGRPIDGPTWVFVFLPGVLVIVVFFLYGIILAITTYQKHGPALAIARSQAWVIFAALLFMLLAAYLIFRILLSLQRIQVFDSGLVQRGFFLRSRTYRWIELSGISSSAVRLTFLGKPISTNPAGKIFPTAGRSMDISRGYQGIPKLIEIGKSNLYPLLWPSIKSAVRAGKAVKFGRIILRKEGLEISKKTITWESIARLHTAAGFLVVELHDKSSRKVPTINIPNLELLLEAVEWGHQ